MITSSRTPVPLALSLLAFVVGGLLCLPLAFIGFKALTADGMIWTRLWQTRIPELLWNTTALAVGTAVGTLVLGISTAWLVTRYEFVGRRIWEWALVLPLALPTYVLAYVYSYVLGRGGPAERLWQILAGANSYLPSPAGFEGAVLVMVLDTFPFVYLLTRGALLSYNASYDEVAKACGISRWGTFSRVTLPLIRPAIVAGLSLVILYVVSDFGAVSLLRYQTFTYAVYQQMTGRSDPTAASILSLLLVGFALLFLFGERWFRQQSRYYQTTGRFRSPSRSACGPLKTGGISLYLGAIFFVSFGGPLYLLLTWSGDALAQGMLDSRFFGYVWNSAFLSSLAATIGVLLGIPLVYLATRWPSHLHQATLQAALTGYVLPGPVAALAILVLVSAVAPFWYGSSLVLIVAYVVHFLPSGLQTMEPALQQVTPNLEESARCLGFTTLGTLRRVTLPLIRHGLVAGWILMFLQCMKELPATLLLRPVGFDTLAVRVWLEASEEYFQAAAPAAVLIVLMTIPALLLLVSKDWRAA
jgi:iron(III) transport system permease protein